MGDNEQDKRLQELQLEYVEFLDDYDKDGIYSDLVKQMISNEETRLIVNLNDLRRVNPKRAINLLNHGFEEQLAFSNALREIVGGIDATYAKKALNFFVGFEGSFGAKHVTPRTLTSRNLGNLVCVEGIVTKCSMVRPKVVRSVHYCPATSKHMERSYTDLTSYDAFPSSSAYPTKDDDGNLLETEYGLSTYKDHQTVTIQEMPEKAPTGQLPRSVEVILDNDLVDKCKPGDRIQAVGTFRCLPSKNQGFTTGVFRTILIANNIIQMSKEASLCITPEDVRKCKKFSRQKDTNVFELLARSLAPSIHGHEYIKKALLCMLLGGLEKVLPNGTRLRGDINILLIGDPSVAKSQLLRYVLITAPRAINTTGRGASGVGLTAAVVSDEETGERRLEAGAMVLADRGVVCIDEFDKMSDIDRTAIHEVMEQGCVTISKAGIHARLNARCSVLAAANPVYGRYDQYKTPMENIGMQDSLLSRFDLIFVMLDQVESDHDRTIADHVIRMHRYRSADEQDGEALPLATNADFLSTFDPESVSAQQEDTPIYEKYDSLLHGNTRSKTDKIVSAAFMRKYIHIARAIKPILTQPAADTIAEEYSRLRSHDVENVGVARTQPVTARALETLIRLSTAHARSRLSRNIELEDAEAAIELVQFAYFKKLMEKPRKRRREGADSVSEDDGAEEDGAEAPAPRRKRRTTSGSGTQASSVPDSEDTTAILSASMSNSATAAASAADSEEGVVVAPERLATFKQALTRLFRETRSQSSPLATLENFLATEYKTEKFRLPEIRAALQKMTDDNQVMVADEIVFLI